MIYFSILAVVLYFGGYLMTARFMSTTGLPSDPLDNIISPPKWLYYLCGAPASKEYPKGTMIVGEFRAQIGGIFLGIFLVSSYILKTSTLINAVGFALSMLFTLLLTSYVSKHYPSRNRSVNRKRKK